MFYPGVDCCVRASGEGSRSRILGGVSDKSRPAVWLCGLHGARVRSWAADWQPRKGYLARCKLVLCFLLAPACTLQDASCRCSKSAVRTAEMHSGKRWWRAKDKLLLSTDSRVQPVGSHRRVPDSLIGPLPTCGISRHTQPVSATNSHWPRLFPTSQTHLESRIRVYALLLWSIPSLVYVLG